MTERSESADAVVFECDFDEPPEKVWRALTDPECLDAWLTNEQPSTEYEVLEAEPHRLLRYGCRDREDSGPGVDSEQVLESTVTFELSPREAGGTHLRLTHADFRIVAETCALRMAA